MAAAANNTVKWNLLLLMHLIYLFSRLLNKFTLSKLSPQKQGFILVRTSDPPLFPCCTLFNLFIFSFINLIASNVRIWWWSWWWVAAMVKNRIDLFTNNTNLMQRIKGNTRPTYLGKGMRWDGSGHCCEHRQLSFLCVLLTDSCLSVVVKHREQFLHIHSSQRPSDYYWLFILMPFLAVHCNKSWFQTYSCV